MEAVEEGARPGAGMEVAGVAGALLAGANPLPTGLNSLAVGLKVKDLAKGLSAVLGFGAISLLSGLVTERSEPTALVTSPSFPGVVAPPLLVLSFDPIDPDLSRVSSVWLNALNSVKSTLLVNNKYQER